jgi:protein phosphatase
VVRNQSQQLRRSLRGLEREGFRYVFRLSSPDEVDGATIERQPLWNNRKDEHGPFDIIGDVHGCLDELLELLALLGYGVERQDSGFAVKTPDGRKAVFVGDLVDRGPATPDVVKLAMSMVSAGQAFCVPGNHDIKLVKALKGRDVQLTHGLAESMQQLGDQPEDFRTQAAKFLDGLVSHYVFDDGKLVVAHAGLKESMQGRGSGKVRDFALYGETTGETDDFGLPVRYNWSADYRGKALVVYGHTPVAEPLWLNNTVNIDTGCVFGGRLTALRYPEREIVSVRASIPRTSPRMIRSGRQRSADFSRSSKAMLALKVSVWHSTDRRFGFCKWSSEVSSITTMRCSSGIADARARSTVVFPVEVPPLMRSVFPLRICAARRSASGRVSVPRAIRSSTV